MIRILLYGMIAMALISTKIVSSAVTQSTPALPTLITSVDTLALARSFGVDLKNTSGRINVNSVVYRINKKEVGVVTEFSIGVFPNVDEAKQAFTRSTFGLPLAPIKVEPPSAGDEFVYWHGREGNNGWPSRCLLRRMNCVVSFGFAGKESEMSELAKKIDNLLVHSNELAPKGNAVVIPTVTISAPPVVPIGGMTDIQIQSTADSPIRIGMSREPDLVESGSVLFRQTGAEGKQTISIIMATAGNVIFSREVTIEVVSKEKYAIGRSVNWELPGDALYFLTDPNLKWDTIPSDDREWILLARGTFQYIGSADEKRRYRQLALTDLRMILKPEWLPEQELITVALDHSAGTPVGVAYCSYTLKEKGCNIAFIGDLENGYLFYIEQPFPLPREIKSIRAEDILLPTLLTQKMDQNGNTEALPKTGVLRQSYVRYRSLRPTGDFQQVQIQLIKVRLYESINLRMPNFR